MGNSLNRWLFPILLRLTFNSQLLISRSGCSERNFAQLLEPPFEAAFLPPPNPLERSSESA